MQKSKPPEHIWLTVDTQLTVLPPPYPGPERAVQPVCVAAEHVLPRESEKGVDDLADLTHVHPPAIHEAIRRLAHDGVHCMLAGPHLVAIQSGSAGHHMTQSPASVQAAVDQRPHLFQVPARQGAPASPGGSWRGSYGPTTLSSRRQCCYTGRRGPARAGRSTA